MSGTVFVGCGVVFLGNKGRVPFSAFIGGEDVKQIRADITVVLVDGILIMANTTTAAEVGAPAARGLELLKAYQSWESADVARRRGWPPLQIQSSELHLPQLDFVAWDFGVPGDYQLLGQKIERVGYMTTAIDDAVFAVVTPLRHGDDITQIIPKVTRIMMTLKRLPQPRDLDEVSNEVKRNPGGWPDCQPDTTRVRTALSGPTARAAVGPPRDDREIVRASAGTPSGRRPPGS